MNIFIQSKNINETIFYYILSSNLTNINI